MPTTSQYAWSTPAPTDPDDVPTYLASLASQIESTMSEILGRLPYRILTGQVTITPTAANTPTSVSVTFPAGLFTATPIVVAIPHTSAPGTQVTGVGIGGSSASGCTIVGTRTNTTSFTVSWIAIQV